MTPCKSSAERPRPRMPPLSERSMEAESHLLVILGIFGVSLISISFPRLSKRLTFLRIPHLLFFIGKHFGTGVILSTAFCHLLPDAFESLQNDDVNEAYPRIGKWAGLIILGSLLAIFLIEYTSTSYVDYLYAEPSEPPSPIPSSPPPSDGSLTSNFNICQKTSTNSNSTAASLSFASTVQRGEATEVTPLLTQTPKIRRSQSCCNLDQHIGDDASVLPPIFLTSPRLSRGGLPLSGMVWHDISCLCRRVLSQSNGIDDTSRVSERGDVTHSGGRIKDVELKAGRKRQIIGILVLQCGIMIHSFVVGLTLAVTSGPDFASLVTAVIFHQLFEGLSLGIRMAGIPPAHSHSRYLDMESCALMTSRKLLRWRPDWLPSTLSLLFAVTTPFGMVIGLLVFRPSAVSSDSSRMLLIQGLMSAMSTGMLIYAATVEMLAGDFVFSDVGGDDHGHHLHTGHTHDEHAHSVDEPTHRGRRDELGQRERSLAHPGKRVLAVVSLLAGSGTMAIVGLSEH